jgi:hypothetical protein
MLIAGDTVYHDAESDLEEEGVLSASIDPPKVTSLQDMCRQRSSRHAPVCTAIRGCSLFTKLD